MTQNIFNIVQDPDLLDVQLFCLASTIDCMHIVETVTSRVAAEPAAR